MELSLVILSFTTDVNSSAILANVINSFQNHTKVSYEIIVIESGELEKAKVIVPEEVILKQYIGDSFNFHRALNQGLQMANGKRICFTNNDVVFYSNWYSTLSKVMVDYHLQLASPVDPTDDKLWMYDKKGVDCIIGYEIQKHFKGWCFVAEKSVFKKIESFDEDFDFYWADNDFILEVLRANLRHGIALNSRVKHLDKIKELELKKIDLLQSKLGSLYNQIPDYILKRNEFWKIQNKRMVRGLISYHKKWGNPRVLNKRIKLASHLQKINLGFLNRIVLYRKYVRK